MKKLRERLRSFPTTKERIGFLRKQNTEVTPEILELIQEPWMRTGATYILPHKVYELIKLILKHSKVNSILDPFCGDGTLLYHLNQWKNLTGFDQNADALELARLLNPHATFEQRHILRNPLHEKYDAIATTHLPFGPGPMMRHVTQTVIWLVNDGLKKNGSLILVVPDNALTAPVFSNFREAILKNYSLEIIASLGRLRRPSPQLEMSLMLIKRKKQRTNVFLADFSEQSAQALFNQFKRKKGDFWVPSKDLTLRWDRNFHDPLYLEFEKELAKRDTRTLEELATEITRGFVAKSEHRREAGEYLVLTPRNLQDNKIVDTKHNYYVDDLIETERRFERCILHEGDVLITVLGPKYRTYVYKASDPKAVANQNFAIIRAKDNTYIKTYLESETGNEEFVKQAKRMGRGFIKSLSLKDLRGILIPILPLDDLNALATPAERNRPFRDSAISSALTNMLENLGWIVKLEYKIDGRAVDIALFHNDRLEAFIEIKQRYSAPRLLGQIAEQLESYKKITGVARCFTYLDGQFHEFVDNQFVPLKDFPKPSPVIRDLDDLATVASAMAEHSLRELDSEAGVKAAPPRASDLAYREFEVESSGFKFAAELLSRFLSIEADVRTIRETTERTQERVTQVLSIVKDLQTEFSTLKEAPLEIEDKLVLLNQQLDRKIASISADSQEQLQACKDIVKRWLSFDWERLEELTKRYLPSAEYLFISLSRLADGDLSPFIIQYCRALENEMLEKIFRAYLAELTARNVDVEKDFAWDFGKKATGKPNSENTFNLAKHFGKCLQNDPSNWFFELGSMENILRYLTGRTATKSPVLQDIKAFLLRYFEENILELEFLDELKRVTNEYRNRAAHPDIITLEEAKNGQKDIRKLLKSFLEYYK